MSEEQIRAALQDRRLSVVAERTGLSLNTLHRFLRGTHNPRRTTIAILAAYLKGSKHG